MIFHFDDIYLREIEQFIFGKLSNSLNPYKQLRTATYPQNESYVLKAFVVHRNNN